MKQKQLVMSLFLGLTFVSTLASAKRLPNEERKQVIDRREESQERRIEQGEKRNELTKREERRLEKEQVHIDKIEQKVLADGKITKKEFKRIEKAQNKASNDIYRKKHNQKEVK